MILIIMVVDVVYGVKEVVLFLLFDLWYFFFQIFWLVLLFGFFYFVFLCFILLSIGNILEWCESLIVSDFDEVVCFNEEVVDVQKVVEVFIVKVYVKVCEIVDKVCVKIDVNIVKEIVKVDVEVDVKLVDVEI